VGLVMAMVVVAACQPAEERFDEIDGPLAEAVLVPDELDVDLSELELDVGRIVDRVRSSRLQAHVGALAEPRPNDSPGAQRAARYVETTLRHLGYRVERQSATAPNGVTMPNIFSTNRGTECPEKLFVVGGHYDSVAGTPGADDDASGVAGMLEIARVLRHVDLPVSVRFAGFALEENGLVGSGVMAQDLHDRGVDVVGMVSLEMIGYTSESTDVLLGTTQDYLTMFGDLPSLDLARVFGAASLEFVPFHFAPAGVIDPAGFPDVLRSDHAPFWRQGYPALLVTDTADFRNPNYHSATDTIDTLDFGFMTDSVRSVVAGLVAHTTLDTDRDGTPDVCASP
jgi:hypothetical protein